MSKLKFIIIHADHGISKDQLAHIESVIRNEIPDPGFFLHQISIPSDLTSVPCALYGPAMGDDPVDRSRVTMQKRSEDRAADPMLVGSESRPVDYVQAIGIVGEEEINLFTVYGGPAAPRNPEDPSIETDAEREESRKFWSEHALATG